MESFLADLIEEQRKQGLYAIGLVHGQPLDDDPSWLHRVKVQAQILFAPVGLGFPLTLRRLVRQFEPDVLHLHMPNNAVFWALLMRTTRRVPWVIHWQSDVVPSRIRKALSIAYAFYRPFENAVVRRASAVIATSPDYLEASEPLQAWRDKCQVIPLGIRVSPLVQDKPPAVDSEWRPGVLRLFSLGRLTYYKGFETLIRAVSSLPGVQLLIAGDGDTRAELQSVIQACTPAGQPSCTQLLGEVDEDRKHQLLRDCDVFCLASRERTEAFGIVLLEAMQHARPCLVSDLPGSGMPWVVRQSGAGLTAVLDDVPSWREAIVRLRDDAALRTRLGAAGWSAARRSFSIEECAHQVANTYLGVSEDVHPVPADRGTLVVIAAHNAETAIGPTITALRAGGWADLLVVDQGSVDRTIELARQINAPVVCPVLPVSAWGAVQTGLRHALRQGYRRVVTLEASQVPTVADLQRLVDQAAAEDAPVDVVIATSTDSAGRQRQDDTNLLPSGSAAIRRTTSMLRVYNHDAMVVCASREATLLDHEDVGTLMLMHKARLRIAEVPVHLPRPDGTPRASLRARLKALPTALATGLLFISRWDRRHARRRGPRRQPAQAPITRS